ncbi:MAG: hypothetical protein DDT30_00468 [Dehalococcoidia bacterium]|nr:hypothetical protein [Bacillota bacterium]
MTKYNVCETDAWGCHLIKRKGQAEMWHNPKSDAYAVYLFEHVNDERFLLHATKYTRELADWVFDGVVSLLAEVVSIEAGKCKCGCGRVVPSDADYVPGHDLINRNRLVDRAGGVDKLTELLNLVDAYEAGRITADDLAGGISRL